MGDATSIPQVTPAPEPSLPGPFISHTTESSVRFWLHLATAPAASQPLVITLRESALTSPIVASADLVVMADALNTGVVDVAGLTPDTVYYYELAWKHDGSSLALEGVEAADLHVRTLPAGGFRDRLDFLLLSCHDPTRALVQYYLEGFPERQNMFFDITRGSHVERISWARVGSCCARLIIYAPPEAPTSRLS